MRTSYCFHVFLSLLYCVQAQVEEFGEPLPSDLLQVGGVVYPSGTLFTPGDLQEDLGDFRTLNPGILLGPNITDSDVRKRQYSCDPGYGLCSDLRCCPSNGQCCNGMPNVTLLYELMV